MAPQAQNQTHSAPQVKNDAETKPKFGLSYVFRLRKHISGPFANLWELSILDSKACDKILVTKMISDADALIYCMDNLQGVLEDDGL